MYLESHRYPYSLSSMLTFAVVILCATGSNTMALPLLVLPSGFGSRGGTESLDILCQIVKGDDSREVRVRDVPRKTTQEIRPFVFNS